MRKRILELLLVGCVMSGALWVANAAEDPFVGQWKLNGSRSKLTDVMKVESIGASKYAFDFEGGTPETITVDGTDQPGEGGTTLAVTAVAPDAWKVVRKKDGRTMITANWKLSPDGNTLTDDFTYIPPNGSASSVKYEYQRTAGKAGFAGTWESTSAQVDLVFGLQIQAYEGDGLTFINPEGTKSVKFDGKDYATPGPRGFACSGKRVDERTLELVDKVKGKPIATEQLALSPDHKSLTMTVLPAGRDKGNVLVFDRQ